jgi:hypothetical protein
MTKDRQRARGRRRLAAARKGRSAHDIPGAGASPEDGELVPKHDDFQLLEIGRPTAQGIEVNSGADYSADTAELISRGFLIGEQP